ncbi:MAG TPA: TonB-dependent receptor, partial [Longimicrobium sp.]|nr:TonB-dependent receptor [Longimicrobium sp.]
ARAPPRAPRPIRRGESPGGAISARTGNIAARNPVEPGDLAASAGISGQYLPSSGGGLSIAGQPPSANRTTLDGAGFDAQNLPPEALAAAGVIPHPYDVSRGQFTGGEIAGRTMSGTNLWGGAGRISLQHPLLQYDGRLGSLPEPGFRQTQISGGGGGGGPIVPGRLFVYAAAQGSRRTSFRPRLGPTSPDLYRYGVSADSVQRLVDVVKALGFDDAGALSDGERRVSSGGALARFDYLPNEHHSLMLRLDGRANRSTGSFNSPFVLVSGGRNEALGGGALVQLASRVRTASNELNVHRSESFQRSIPDFVGPVGQVRLGSGAEGSSSFSFGGSPVSVPDEDRSAIEVSDRLLVLLRGGTHQLQLGGTLARERVRRRASTGHFGTFTFASLDDLEGGRALQFTRSLGDAMGEITTRYAAAYLGDQWTVGRGLRVAFGARLERFEFKRPPSTDSMGSAFTVQRAPDTAPWSVSPRAGFTWVRLTDSNEWIVRGGIGSFRAAPPARPLAALLSEAGLTDASVRLVCVGSAVPLADWREYQRDAGTIPTRCASDSPGMSSSSPGVTGFSRGYRPSGVWHSSLEANWMHRPSLTSIEATLTFSRGYNLALARDVNLDGDPRFTLTGEAGRPMYVDPGTIDETSGQVVLEGSRRVAGVGVVREINASGSSASRDFSVGVGRLTGLGLFQAYYSYSRSRDQATGLAGLSGGISTTAADPRSAEWASTDFEQRHAFQLSANRRLHSRITINLVGRLLSGTPFTPVVESDINGDGVANDRAFIFDPASVTDLELRRGLAELLNVAPSATRSCLLRQAGRIAERNSCRTPWTPYLDVQMNVSPGGVRNSPIVFAIIAQNATAGLDYLVHGPDRLRGWGQNPLPDPVLLRARGFDPRTRDFRYEVNPRFGPETTRSGRVPFTVRIQGRITLGADPATQALVASVASMQGVMSPSELEADLVRRWRNVPARVLQYAQVSPLGLTAEQAAAMRIADDSVARRVGVIAKGLGEASALSVTGAATSRDLLREGQRVITAGYDAARSILTREQWAALPPGLREVPRATVPLLSNGGISLMPDF